MSIRKKEQKLKKQKTEKENKTKSLFFEINNFLTLYVDQENKRKNTNYKYQEGKS